MEDDFSIDFGELQKFPDLDLSENGSINTNYEEKISQILNGEEIDPNIDKIFEYLNDDIQEQQHLIDKLKEFEIKLDDYLSKHTKEFYIF